MNYFRFITDVWQGLRCASESIFRLSINIVEFFELGSFIYYIRKILQKMYISYPLIRTRTYPALSDWLVYKFSSKSDEIVILMVFKWLIYIFKTKRNLFFLFAYSLQLVT